jgi:hypothetical protein
LVLNPEWISQGVYKIVNWVSNAGKYTLTFADFPSIFSDEKNRLRYPDEKSYSFLFELMKCYELAYAETKKRLVIPHLLKEDRPKELPTFEVEKSLKIKYTASLPLPPNTISRFIVRHHAQIKSKQLLWKYGVLLVDSKGSEALVREDTKERTISVSVRGKTMSHYIDELRTTLNDIFNSYKSEFPELSYQIQRFGEIKMAMPHPSAGVPPPAPSSNQEAFWLPESKIVNHVARRRDYFDDVSGQDIPLQPIVHQYKIEARNLYLHSEIENITENNFNFQDCNFELQGSFNDLAQLLESDGKTKEAKQLAYAAQLLEQVEEAQTPKEIKKKGIGNRLKRVVLAMGNEDSNLHKAITGIENGIDIAQDIAATYNDVAQWCGLPQVPKPFLKKK